MRNLGLILSLLLGVLINAGGALPAFSQPLENTIYLSKLQNKDLFKDQTFYSTNADFPDDVSELKNWQQTLSEHPKIQFDGDIFWTAHSFYNDTDQKKWTAYLFGSAVGHIEFKLYPLNRSQQANIQNAKTGYFATHEVPYHYSVSFDLEPQTEYVLLARLSSDFFFAPLRMQFKPSSEFLRQAKIENVIIILCFGIGLALALFNAFVYFGTRQRIYLYYALFTLSWMWGWAHTFNLPEEWFGTRTPGFLMAGFLLIPIFNALFFINFLQVRESNPWLSKAAIGFGVVGIAGLPIAIESPALGLMLASICTGGMLVVGFTLGVKALLAGFKPARYFLLAYIMLLMPNMVGNLMNMGFIPSMNINIYLLGLIGTMLDGLLLAFAMAEKVRLVNLKNVELNENLEEKVAHRTEKLERTKQDLIEANQAKSRFLAQMSHEIRTPMNAVIGLSQLALKTPLNFEQKDYIQKISGSADVLLGIINDVLDYSKIEAGKLHIDKINFDLTKTIERAVSLCSLKAHTKNIEIILDIQPDVPKFIESDPLRLQQILVNIIANAVKFTEFGHVSIRVSATPLASGDNPAEYKLEFVVVDTGIGMNQQQVSQLFNSFAQADNSITRKYGGTGLGLSISKELVQLLGGDIWVNSKPNVGSAFHFSITAKSTEKAISNKVFTIKGRPLNVLIVDDNQVASEVVSALFKRHKAHITLVKNGAKAITELKKSIQIRQAYDLVIMDWKMPEMDGIEAAKIIKHDLNLSKLPAILMISAYDKDEAKRLGESAGIDAFIEKPVGESTLFNVISECLPLDSLQAQENFVESEPNILLDLSNINLLLVEDNKLNRQVAAGFLRDTKIQIDVAENGIQAIEKVSKQSFDIVLMDIQMPEMDGLTATQEIRKMDGFSDLPIIAMTAHAMEGDKQRSYEAGMDDHLTKPVDPYELYRCIVKWIDKDKLKKQEPEAITLNVNEKKLSNLQSIGLLNVAGALKQMHGKEALYIDLLATFIEENENLVEEINQLAKDKNLHGLRLKVHSLKSNAAYIGAEQLAKDAADIEVLIDQGQVFETRLVSLTDKLSSLLAELVVFSPQVKPQVSSQTKEFTDKEIDEMFKQIVHYLKTSNAKIEDYIEPLKQLGCQLDDGAFIEALIDEIEDVEYKKALILIENNKRDLNLSM
ncbi:response regulator [Catenovulum adriaticum]|uniref:histidine kinase n=1 Tax=Catenovulum adriaticum TaxID=2984846 RepID=A0ABY7APN7_9ALTE|nr:response regulator [Catenovulum sp. TS8]WAJ71198.1 response regulator [Catenovulum sp. TS8]